MQWRANGMSKGSIITGPAAVLAFVGFFMPWVTSSCSGQEVATLTGYELATGTTVEVRPVEQAPIGQTRQIPGQRRLLAIPFAAVICLALVSLMALHRVRPTLAGAIVVVLAVGCLLIMLNRTLEMRSQADENGFDVRTRYGVFVVAAANVALLAGGVLDIVFGWRTRRAQPAAVGDGVGPGPPGGG
jgi:hypothetical protein